MPKKSVKIDEKILKYDDMEHSDKPLNTLLENTNNEIDKEFEEQIALVENDEKSIFEKMSIKVEEKIPFINWNTINQTVIGCITQIHEKYFIYRDNNNRLMGFAFNKSSKTQISILKLKIGSFFKLVNIKFTLGQNQRYPNVIIYKYCIPCESFFTSKTIQYCKH